MVEGLLRRHLIAAAETLREGNRPERTVYRLTEAGRIELIARPAKEFTPEEVVRLLAERRERLEVKVAQAGSLRDLLSPKLPRLFYIEAEYRWKLKEAELDFVRDLIDDIVSDKLGGLDFWRKAHAALAKGEPAPAFQESDGWREPDPR